ncbi:hypothetical protein KXD40_006374 [Peronospora effusa]|uniref:Uncharacterized protein n=1 Tax=Peronospora effusa TaxID=542832 RepID=A0A3M6VJT3_9STRA|nr:hypothetical protein DD238_001662 [Peronospora effusa]RQM16990.1 hypothetical protein DD237_001509 [Peronospora effusa]UIZ25647.1 hypothetical protein KXD40_006374 [Peronospora effusa]CAI5706377.1 unnamed protein product [Peronospora effusa]
MGFIGWPLGLLLSAISSIFGITGKLLLKLAHNERDKEEEIAAAAVAEREEPVVFTVKTTRGCTYFYCGLFSMLVVNPSLGALAYCFATQSLLAPMAGLTIGWNTLFGPMLLPHERLTTNDFVGAVLIFTGCVLVGVSGTHKSPPLPVEVLRAQFQSLSFIVYCVGLLVLLSFLIHHAKHALHFTTTSRRAGVKSSPVSSPDELPMISRVSLSIFAGVMSGQLFFLAAVMRIAHDNGASHIWSYSLTYICIVGAVSTALFGLYLLNEALAVEDAVVVIYLYEASYIMAGAISGLCLFRDMAHLPTWHYVLYSLSLVLILLGIYTVAKRSLPKVPQDEEYLLLPLLAPLSAEDASVEGIFQQASYYARRASYSGPAMLYAKIQSNYDDSETPERRKSMPIK